MGRSRVFQLLVALRLLLVVPLCEAFQHITPYSAATTGGSLRTCSFTSSSLTRQRLFYSSSTTTTTTQTTTSSLNMAYKNVFVAGGSRGVGRLVIEKLLTTGAQVKALVRNPDVAADLNKLEGVTAIVGDAFDQKTVENAMDGCDAAITTLGGSTQDRRVDYEGNNNVIESAGILGIQRVILVTSVGCGNSKEAAPPGVFEVLKDVLAAKERAENIMIKYYTNTNWTIIRPGGLVTEPMTGKACLTENNLVIGSIHREDVADLVVKALNSANTERKIFSALDPSIPSAANPEGETFEAFELATSSSTALKLILK